MGVPKEIREVPRPVNTVVVDSGNDTDLRYAVRERAASGKYVPGRNPAPKNGRVIGHIIDFKYVPADASDSGSAGGSNKKQASAEHGKAESRKNDAAQDELSDSSDHFLMYGAPAFAHSQSGDIFDDLLEIYSIHDACSILVMAILRIIVPGITCAECAGYFRSAFLKVFYPGTPLSGSHISALIDGSCSDPCLRIRLAGKRVSRVPEDHHIAVGMTPVTGRGMPGDLPDYSCISQDPDAEDVYVMYAYDTETNEPVCTKIRTGNAPSTDDFEAFVLENGIKSGILLAGGDFSPDEIRGTFEGPSGLHYIRPVDRNDGIMEKYGIGSWDRPFGFRGDFVFYQKVQAGGGKILYAFRSMGKAVAEENAFLKAAQRNGGEFDPDDFQRMREISGVSLFEADLDLKPDTVYRAVQYRWLPGLLFRRCMIDFPRINRTSWLDDGRLRGLGLIASVSALITVRMLNAAQNAGLLDRMSFGELMARLRLVRRMEEHGSSGKVPDAGDGRWSVPDKSSMEILARLGLAGGMEVPAPRKRGRPPKRKQTSGQ